MRNFITPSPFLAPFCYGTFQDIHEFDNNKVKKLFFLTVLSDYTDEFLIIP